MSEKSLNEFVDAVIQRHEVATGLKKQVDHEGIVAYANDMGFAFTLNQWKAYVKQEFDGLNASLQAQVQAASPQHWSWAFRQISSWRAMLMDGSGDGQS